MLRAVAFCACAYVKFKSSGTVHNYGDLPLVIMTGNWYPFPALFIHGPLCTWNQEYPGPIPIENQVGRHFM